MVLSAVCPVVAGGDNVIKSYHKKHCTQKMASKKRNKPKKTLVSSTHLQVKHFS